MTSQQIRLRLGITYSEWARQNGYGTATVRDAIRKWSGRRATKHGHSPTGVTLEILTKMSKDIGQPVSPALHPGDETAA